MGSPIRKSSDQSPVGGSPRHIAASNVLHRSCLPRHPPYALASNTHATCMRRKIPLANSQTTNHHTKNDHKTIETNNRVRFEINSKTKIQKPLFCSRPLSSSQATTHRHADQTGTRPARRHDGHRIAPGKSLGWRSGSPKAHPHHPRTHRTTGGAKPTTSSTPATPPPSHHATRGAHTIGRTSD